MKKMNVISVVRKYIIKDLTGVIKNYYIQNDNWSIGKFGSWEFEYCWGIKCFMFDGACAGGHMEIVKWMLSKGVNNLNWGLYYASKGKHLEIAKLMLSKGLNDDNNYGFISDKCCRQIREYLRSVSL